MACSHVGHDCHVGHNVIFANNCMLAGHVTVEDRAFVSGGVAVHQFCRIGAWRWSAASAGRQGRAAVRHHRRREQFRRRLEYDRPAPQRRHDRQINRSKPPTV